jgi:hypothetical protein
MPLMSMWRKTPPPFPPTPGEALILAAVATLATKLETLMANVADVQAALAANETKEATIIALLTAESSNLKDIQAQLAAAIAAGSDSDALQAIVDKLNADATAMDNAIASVTPPAPAAP